MEQLWAPWRMEFIKGPKPDGCFLCEAATDTEGGDADRYVLARTAYAVALLNRYPYNSGHLMVAPRAHVASLEDLEPPAAQELMQLTQRALRVLRAVLRPEGFNLGINLGQVAGAGVKDHVHQHVVPRWGGDTNFMPVTGDIKVLNEHLGLTYATVRAGFDRMP